MLLPEALSHLLLPPGRVLVSPLASPGASLKGPGLVEVGPSGIPNDGTLAGALASHGGVPGEVRVALRASRVAQVTVTIHCHEEELEPWARAIAAHWGLTLKHRGRGRRLEGRRALDAAVPGTLSLKAFEYETGDRFYCLELSAAVDAPEKLRPVEPLVPLRALAETLVTPTQSESVCIAALEAHVAAGGEQLIPHALRDGLMQLPPAELRQRTHALMALVKQSVPPEEGTFWKALEGTSRARGGWLSLSPDVRLTLLKALGAAPWLEVITNALDFGDSEALAELVAHLGRRRTEGRAVSLDTYPDGSDERLSEALFAVATAGMQLTDLVRFGAERWAPYVVRALTPHVGPPPAFTTTQLLEGLRTRAPAEEAWRLRSVSTAQVLIQARRLDAGLFDALIKVFSHDEAAIFLVSDERVVTATTGAYRLGACVLSWRAGQRMPTITAFADEGLAGEKLKGASKKKSPRKPR